MADSIHVSHQDLVTVLARVLERHGCSAKNAALLARNMADAERDGVLSHGIFRVKEHLSTLASGWIDGTTEPVVEDAAPGVRVDARNGYTLAALDAGGRF